MKALLIALLLTLPLALSAAPKDEEENPPLKQSDLPLPVIVDPSQGDVPVTLDGEVVTVDPLIREFASEDYCSFYNSRNLYDSEDFHYERFTPRCDYIEAITVSFAVPSTGGARLILSMLSSNAYETVAVLQIPPGVTYLERTIRFDTPMKRNDADLSVHVDVFFVTGPLQYPMMWDINLQGYNE